MREGNVITQKDTQSISYEPINAPGAAEQKQNIKYNWSK